MSSNGRERGTASSASATALGMLVRGQALAQHLLDRLAPGLGHRGEVIGAHEPSTPSSRSPSRERVPARQLALVARRGGVERRA